MTTTVLPEQPEPAAQSAASAGRRSVSPLVPRLVASLVLGLSLAVAFNALVLQRGARQEQAKPLEVARKAKAAEPRPISEVAAKTTETVAAVVAKATPANETQRRLELTVAHLEELDPVTPDLVKAIQRELMARGFDPGSADGQNGSLTRAAILSFEFEEGMALTGEPSQILLRRLVLGATSEDARIKATAKPDAASLKLVKAIQQALATLQYSPGAADGMLKAETVRAIREFEMDQGLQPSGRISGRLIGRLARVAGRRFELPTQ